MSDNSEQKLNFNRSLSNEQKLNFGDDSDVEYFVLTYTPDISLKRYTRFILEYSVTSREEANNIRFIKLKLKNYNKTVKASTTKFIDTNLMELKDIIFLDTRDLKSFITDLVVELHIDKIKDNEDYGLNSLRVLIGRDYEPHDAISNAL